MSSSIKGGDRVRGYVKQLNEGLAKGRQVRVGFLEGSTYPDGTPVPLVAAVQEFGGSFEAKNGREIKIPSRPFFRNMLADEGPSWGQQSMKILKAAEFNTDVALGRMGELIKSELQGSIRELTEPPLADSTIKAKGFAKPLVDTGHMLNSVDYEVEG